ncbi:hypothetical protein [Mycobacterium leprae]|uniref:hypothetical protein n=1 Tax=Mycobacterium leprae TaxID=1769 RepID=UPI000301EEA7|nr:hypothetical protein [Mycobacterium leprae]
MSIHNYGEIILITSKDFAYMVAFGIASARLPSEETRRPNAPGVTGTRCTAG